MSALTEDGFLDRRLTVRQPQKGFRAGLDAVMVAAAVPAAAGDHVLELGAGVGTASLCLAARVSGCRITAVEIDADLAQLARTNMRENGFADRIAVEQGDVLAPMKRGVFSHVFCNPPFHDDSARRSPDAARARALSDAGYLKNWLRIGLKHIENKGTFTVILRADRLGEALSVLPQTGIGIFPLWPRDGAAAVRVIVQSRKSARRPPALLAGLVLHGSDGGYSPEADAILRGRADLVGHFAGSSMRDEEAGRDSIETQSAL